MTTDYLTIPYNSLLFLGNSHTLVVVPQNKNKNIFNKFGKLAGKTVRFFRKSETKAAAMLSYWAVETVLFAVIMLTAPTAFVFFSALFLYLYGTYALFSAAMVLI